MITTRRKKAVLGTAVIAIVFVACLDGRPPTSPEIDGQLALRSTAPFGCQVEFTEVSTIQDELMGSYDIPSYTDTSYVCATWTGNDYRVFTHELGSSTPVEMRGDVTAATYDAGMVSSTTANGAADPQPVGPTSFDMGQATPAETQASYEAPFYGVVGGGGGPGGGGDPGDCDTEIESCDPPDEMALRSRRDLTAKSKQVLLSIRSNPEPHGLKRRGARRLTADKEEIGRGANGHRRFRKVEGDVETIVEIDPATELMSAQETRKGPDRSRAELKWRKVNKRYVRESMKVEDVQRVNGKEMRSVATVMITNLKVGGR